MDINGQLRRNIKPGYEYEGLIPKYKGIQHDFEKSPTSDTYDTLKFMALWVEKYHHQMSRIAPKLLGATKEKTVKNTYEFLYWHFQYKLDESLQQLYSPSAAWHFRKTGFDCKTFSLLASCILTELGISHSFRKVQQPGIMPGEWSHVYVIVHDKQKYHVIDATTHSNTEVYFSKKYDFMLKHRGLAGSYSAAMPGKPAFNGLGNNKMATFNGLGCGPNTNCGCGSLNGLGASVSWNEIKGMFSSFQCLGSAAYDAPKLNRNAQDFNTLFTGIVAEVNNAKNSGNMNQLAISVARLQATAELIIKTYTQKRDERNWRNNCTVDNFNATIKIGNFYKTAGIALQGWLQTFFNIGSVANTMTITNQGWEVNGKYWGMNVTPWITISQPVYNITTKATAPNFEITQYVLDASKTNSFNLSSFLQTLSNVANVIAPGSGSGSGSGSGVNTGGIIDGNTPITGSNTSSGISPTAMGVGAVGIIGAILFWPSIKKAVFSNSNSK